ncbi:MAG TPA: TonB-dependent receptor [Bacteroidia bacterium]|nr:TonB-dependent receptor [Bacteroidia bacterium]
MNFQKTPFIILCLVFISTLHSRAQTLTQSIRGNVVDIISQSKLSFSTITLLNSDPLIGTVADIDGHFELKNIPVGKQSLKITCLGYKEQIIPNIVVSSGKEVVLTITLEEIAIQGKEVVITDNIDKNNALNEFSTISTRNFSVEETQKYAAAVNDPARMSTAFAGVISTDDGNNTIAIRGNSPNGLLWRMEGVEIPNPNHFSSVGTSGGGISILSSQLLTNSDFLTGAFAAEYGNALSGVFDMKLRKGNNQKSERTIQLGVLGTDLALEGPIKNGYKGSYLINYRYSTLSMLNKIGVELGGATTTFQDLSFNVFLPTSNLGTFSLFGFGGLSKQYDSADRDSTKWESDYDRYDWNFKSNSGATGLSHFTQLSKQSYLKSTILLSGTRKYYQEAKLDNVYKERSQGGDKYDENKISINSVFTKKFNARNSIKTGVILNKQYFDLFRNSINESTQQIETNIDQKGTGVTLQTFAQWNYKMTEKLTLNTGIHSLGFIDNNTFSIEPRVSLKYDFKSSQSISIGYGLHQQTQPIGVYYALQYSESGNAIQPNRDLGFSKSQHFVAAYDRALNEHTRIKLEGYYQYLYDIPISTDSSDTFSMLNNENEYATIALTNDGKGRNYGLELTVEQFLHNNFYYLLSGSLYNSEYRAANNHWYNTRYNGKYALSFTAGKEFNTGKAFGNRIIGINIKSVFSGGLRSTPIDYNLSVQNGKTEYVESQAYSQKAKDYFRIDTKLSVKRNRPKSTTTWSLDLQNATNRKNIYGEYYEPSTGETKTIYQAPLIPVLSYRIDF